MKRAAQISFSIFVSLFLFQVAWSQVGPSWLIQGNLQDASQIRDFLEIPNTNIIIAAGRKWSDQAALWKSTDNGNTWNKKYEKWAASNGAVQLEYAEAKNVIFAGFGDAVWGQLTWVSIVYSTDQGETWIEITHPAMLGDHAGANSILLLNNKLYIAYRENHSENGNSWGIYSAMLFRIDVSDVNPSNWVWEFLMQYPELDFITRLADKDGKLYVFGKDKNSDAIRIFTYDPQTLDRMASRVGTVEEVRLQVEKYQAQLAQQKAENQSSETNAPTPDVPGGKALKQ
ncbi:MAG: exo-alpha-sialidase [Calditrichaeota bacterium]|nr:MAG: exo-alpha-sialidase [Calditrichota bacterium]